VKGLSEGGKFRKERPTCSWGIGEELGDGQENDRGGMATGLVFGKKKWQARTGHERPPPESREQRGLTSQRGGWGKPKQERSIREKVIHKGRFWNPSRKGVWGMERQKFPALPYEGGSEKAIGGRAKSHFRKGHKDRSNGPTAPSK